MPRTRKAARMPYTYNPAYISKSFAFNTGGIGTAETVQVGTLPTGALVTQTIVRVKEAFNAATTNVIIVGTAADDDEFIAAGDVDESATDTTFSARSAGIVLTADTPVYVKYTQTGTAATTGQADVVVTYIPKVED